jgi:hypothetical protein
MITKENTEQEEIASIIKKDGERARQEVKENTENDRDSTRERTRIAETNR